MATSQTDMVKTDENVTLTENGMVTNPTTLNKCVDLFFSIGAMRGKSKDKVISLFNEAYNENPLVASKLLFWSRDVRSGAGERQIFRDIITHLVTTSPQTVRNNIGLIPEFGRWDDVLVLVGTELEGDMFTLIKESLTNGEVYQSLLNNIDYFSEEDCKLILSYIYNCQNDVSSLTHSLIRFLHNEDI